MLEGFVCPYCQHLHENWWEFCSSIDTSFIAVCDQCESHLLVSRLGTGDFHSEEIWLS